MKSRCAVSNKYINSADMTHVLKLQPDLVSSARHALADGPAVRESSTAGNRKIQKGSKRLSSEIKGK
jgi:hypothetical protein